ncbi:FACT complex subunit SSRP1 [Smittium culicis]|uniref:FACT complex subunit SSRP1 n=1 Tax=Smittium culicis TaxID=133412 RepID=A0A1R1Y4G6_9FUNG|nr:FACT complex subunit SSRP1 [Smittium culicis]OMJ21803.1 FACT complex subunit SSRP1 [Smittium culicis]
MDSQGGDRIIMQGLNMNTYPVPFYKDEFDRINAVNMLDIQKMGSVPNPASRDIRRFNGPPKQPPNQPGDRFNNDYVNMQHSSSPRNNFSYSLHPSNSMNHNIYGQGNPAPQHQQPHNQVHNQVHSQTHSQPPNPVIHDSPLYYPSHSQNGPIFSVERSQHMLSSHPYSTVTSHITSISNSPYKRKYKKHPKKDPNAPEKWKSAYQLFREDLNKKLEHKKLSFVDLSKIHSDQWSNLDASRKMFYDELAKNAKDEYEKLMNQYRKSPQYKEYQEYLNQFYAQEDTVGRVGRPKGKKSSNSSGSTVDKAKYSQPIVHQNFGQFTNMER